jgi:MFS family permease
MSSINTPVPALDDSTTAAETETPPSSDEAIVVHESRNLLVLAAHHIVLRVAWIFKTESVIMPAFVDAIAGPGSGWLRGCLPVLNRFGQSVPPLMLADRLKHTRRKKWPLFWSTLLMAVPFLVLSALMLSLSWLGMMERRLSWLPPLFLLLYFVFFSMTGLNQMVFSTIQGKLIRPNRRGRLMGLSVTLGAVCAIPCAWFLLPRWLGLPDGGYGFVFAFTGIGFVAAAFFTLFLFEPADHIDGMPARAKNHFRGAWNILRRDRNFRRLAVAGMLCMTGQLLFPHYQALAREVLHAPRENLMVWVVAQNAGAGLFGFLAGVIADRWGNRLAIRLEIAVVIAAPMSALGLAVGVPPGGAAYLWVSFFLLGLTPVMMRTLMNFALELSEPADHPRYISTLKLCMAVPFVFSPLIGLLVDVAGFRIVFASIACLIALGGVMTFRLAEPRRDNSSVV